VEGEKTLLVVGGTSDIGRATALHYANKGWRILLSGRDAEALRREVSNITTRTGVAVSDHVLDIFQTGQFRLFIDELADLPDAVVCAVGVLGDQRRAEIDPEYAATVMRANYEGPSLFLGLIAERFAARGRGTIIGISSVAGDRGRASNYVYGSAKAGLTTFLSGLRNRMARMKVQVITVKPGFVRTRMTEGMKLPAALTAEPAEVAAAIYAAHQRGRDVVYIRPVWRAVMAIIRLIPEFVFKKTRL
jgi:hypothetical protein